MTDTKWISPTGHPIAKRETDSDAIPSAQEALAIFDRFCAFINGLHMGGFVENDFMSKSEQKTIRSALEAMGKPPTMRGE